jgi:hypothetical protein
MGDTNPNIQRISFEEIQEFKDLDLFNLTWEQTNKRLVLLAYDPQSKTFGYSYAAPGTDGGDQNISLFYGYSSLIANALDNQALAARPSINGFDNGDGIIAMSTVGSVKKFDFYDVEISLEHGIDRYIYRTNLMPTVYSQPVDGVTPVKGVDYFDGITPVKGVDYFDGVTPVKGVDYFDGAPVPTNLQRVLVHPADFIGTNYVLKNEDNNYELIIDNGTTDVTLTVPVALSSKIGIGFTQKGLGNVRYVEQGTAVKNPTGLFIKGQYYQTYLSQEGATNVFYLGGDTKATSAAAPTSGGGTTPSAFSIVLDSVSADCVYFTTTGTAQTAITVQKSMDNGVTWLSYTGSFASPRCGFPAAAQSTQYRMASIDAPIVYSNVVTQAGTGTTTVGYAEIGIGDCNTAVNGWTQKFFTRPLTADYRPVNGEIVYNDQALTEPMTEPQPYTVRMRFTENGQVTNFPYTFVVSGAGVISEVTDCGTNTTPSGTVTQNQSFDVNNNEAGDIYFDLFIDGANMSGPRLVSANSTTNVTATANGANATVVFRQSSGIMPASAELSYRMGSIVAVISGNDITFSGVDLTVSQTLTVYMPTPVGIN